MAGGTRALKANAKREPMGTEMATREMQILFDGSEEILENLMTMKKVI
jgi:hypothetical protein